MTLLYHKRVAALPWRALQLVLQQGTRKFGFLGESGVNLNLVPGERLSWVHVEASVHGSRTSSLRLQLAQSSVQPTVSHILFQCYPILLVSDYFQKRF